MPEPGQRSVDLDIWVVAAMLAILACIVYSAWRQVSFSIIASVACVVVFALAVIAEQAGDAQIGNNLAYQPHDIIEPSRVYTLLTSMFMHASFTHIFLNLFVLILMGLVFEQRIGTRPFIVLYIIAGLVGTLSFAAVRWGDPLTSVVGASGAIMGILGGFARLYPNEKMMLFPIPVPMSIWTVVLILVGLQFLLFFGASHIAVEAHLGGLVAGAILAPYVVRLPLRQRTRARKVLTISGSQLRRLATTPQLRSMFDRIEHEEVADVRSAWIEHFLSTAKCPTCGSKLRIDKGSIMCEKGHIV